MCYQKIKIRSTQQNHTAVCIQLYQECDDHTYAYIRGPGDVIKAYATQHNTYLSHIHVDPGILVPGTVPSHTMYMRGHVFSHPA